MLLKSRSPYSGQVLADLQLQSHDCDVEVSSYMILHSSEHGFARGRHMAQISQ
jgi:hypothetical protein